MSFDSTIWLTSGMLAAMGVGLIYVALPVGAKLILRKRFLNSAKSRKTIFLTFDDGPSLEGTPQILELLKMADARATFFVLGKNVERFPNIAGSILSNGHEIGEHSYAHSHAWRSGPLKTWRDLVAGNRAIKSLSPTGASSAFFRPPYGKFNLISLLYILLGKKRVAFWNIDPKDYCAVSAREVANHVIRKLQAGCVVLLHDGRYRDGGDAGVTVAALEMILEACREKGLRADTLRDGIPACGSQRKKV
jgi:peptidoglycan/xylan/chitin deacetylase (PgdA/CDA1 family)